MPAGAPCWSTRPHVTIWGMDGGMMRATGIWCRFAHSATPSNSPYQCRHPGESKSPPGLQRLYRCGLRWGNLAQELAEPVCKSPASTLPPRSIEAARQHAREQGFTSTTLKDSAKSGPLNRKLLMLFAAATFSDMSMISLWLSPRFPRFCGPAACFSCDDQSDREQ